MHFKLKDSIRHCLTTEVTKTLVTSLVLSRLDYCNAVLAGTSKKFLSRLQVVQNNAARLILKKKNSTSATPLLKELHWLPIAQRIDYKCALFCFKCIHGVAPHYLREILNFYKPRRSLRSTEDSFVLETPKTKLKSFGDRAFSSYGPRIWNSLPKRIRDIDKIEIFKKQLKHHLFLKTLCENNLFKQNYMCLILMYVIFTCISYLYKVYLSYAPKLFKVLVSF